MKPGEQDLREWAKSLKERSVEELETLLAEMEQQETQALEPLTRRIGEVIRLLKRKKAKSPPRVYAVAYDSAVAGLPITPVIHAPENPIGDINLLMNTVPLIKAPFDRIVIDLAHELISQTGGLVPVMEVKPMACGEIRGQRMVAKWVIPRAISMEEMSSIERLAKVAYQRHVAGHKKEGTGWEKIGKYRDMENKTITGKEGIYFGPESYWDSEATGVTVCRQFANSAEAKYLSQAHPEDWICRSVEKTIKKTEIELREGPVGDKDKGGLAQDKFLELVVQISYLLAKRRLIESRILMTAIFRALNKVGTATTEREKLYGMKKTLEVIERVLLLPLRRPDLAGTYRFRSESVLLIGVPGIGKTFLSHFLMTGEYNAIFASIDSDRLREDLEKSGETGVSAIFLKIDTIKSACGLPVILLIDDIDVILNKDKEGVVSKFLNLMQGIRQRGFHILASTNYPEKIDQRLLEPGRLSKIVQVELPNERDRAGVLSNHLAGLPFESEEAQKAIIKKMAKETSGWTQRYLWELCVEAGRIIGLEIDESHQKIAIQQHVPPLLVAHFETACADLSKTIDLKGLRDWDRRIKLFTSRTNKGLGFTV